MGTTYQTSIPGWTSLRELTWLRDTSSQMRSVVEVGSFQGRSTHALLCGCRGLVWAVDTWLPFDGGWQMRRPGWGGNAWPKFIAHVGHFPHLRIVRADSLEAAKMFAAKGVRFDMAFLDADHSEEGVRADIDAYRQLLNPGGLLCGHDYHGVKRWEHRGVRLAVDAMLGRVEHVGTIWFKRL